MNDSSLLPELKQRFGFDSFRPGQEAIVRDILAGRDVLAIMPTGGGKSLCFQLPALLRPGVCIVVSPLIALMQDQVDALLQFGVRAAFLNSSLDAEAARAVQRRLFAGELDLLYVAPERLVTEGFVSALERVCAGTGLARAAAVSGAPVHTRGHHDRHAGRAAARKLIQR